MDWAIGELSAFIDLSTLVKPAPTPGVTFFGDDRYREVERIRSSLQRTSQSNP